MPAIQADAERLSRVLGTPCGGEFVVKCLATVANACAFRASMTPADAKAKMATYANLLGDYPAECVAEGCRRYAVSETWFPALAELLRYIDPLRDRMRADLAKLRTLEALAGKSNAADEGSKWGPIGEDMRSKVAGVIARLRQP